MTKDNKNLPAVRLGRDEIARRLDGAANALQVRDPITGFFHGIGSRAAARALDHHTAETQAFTRNIDAQSEAVRSMVSLRNTIDEYRARDELADLCYDNTRARLVEKIVDEEHGRAIADKRRKTEHLDADRGVFNADYGLDLQKQFRGTDAEWRRKQRDLRDLNLRAEITVTRDELGDHIDERNRRRTDVRAEQPAERSTIDTLRYQLLESYREAIAAGADEEAAKINEAIAALDGKR
jgi:hypothetical protein